MLALVATAFFLLYLFAPAFLFRRIVGAFIPLKKVSGSREEIALRYGFSLWLPFVFAYLLVWYVPVFDRWPAGFDDSRPLRKQDRRLLGRVLIEDSFLVRGRTLPSPEGDLKPELSQAKKLAQNSEIIFAEEAFWDALTRDARRNFRLLFWYYVLVVMAAACYVYLGKRYGRLKWNATFTRLAEQFLIPNISEWQLLLTPFTFANQQAKIFADVLCTNNVLYRGQVAHHFLDQKEDLAALILTDTARFDREEYDRARVGIQSGKNTSQWREQFWVDIPGAKLLFPAGQIFNLNLSSDAYDETTQSAVRRILEIGVIISPRTQLQRPGPWEAKGI